MGEEEKKNEDEDEAISTSAMEHAKKMRKFITGKAKGIMGKKKEKDEHAFSKITGLADLQNYIAGQGHDWPDAEILRFNNLKYFTSNLFFLTLAAARSLELISM